MIEQQHQSIGRWQLQTRENLPAHIRDTFENFGHIIITPGVLRGAVNRTSLLANSMYTGLVLKHRKRFDLSVELEGAGLLAWLGYSDTRGPLPQFSGLTSDSTPTWADIVSTSTATQMGVFRPIHDATNGLSLGTVYGTTTFSGQQVVATQYITRRQVSHDGNVQMLGGADTDVEFRVSPTGEFESGDPTAAGFWRRDPEVILTRGTSLVEAELRSLQIVDLDVEYDGTTYATDAAAKAEDGGGVDYSDRVSDPIQNFTGSSGARWTALVTLQDDTATASARTAAAEQRIGFEGESTTIKVTVDNHPHFPTFCEPGDYVYIHDPDTGLTDTANQVNFGGTHIYPVKVRVYGTHWPVIEGRGVYYATNDWQTIIDVAPHMAWEDGPIDMEVGSPLRASVQIVDWARPS